MNSVIKQYLPLVNFLAEIVGENVEIVLHDFSNIEHSVVAIRNGHVSERSLGAPATNLALKIMNDASFAQKDYLVNYHSLSLNGKTLKASSFIIRNEQQQVVGMLCVNSDMTKCESCNTLADCMRNESGENSLELLGRTVDEVTEECIQSAIERYNLLPERFSQSEKLEIINELYQNGVFLMKGSVSKVASKLKASEASIYRYLNKIRKED
ncbi:MAG: helix-turn-helix transcriptional regulator [Saccharofermentanales bacterium]|jgi:predicted transcriptional regulator YheO